MREILKIKFDAPFIPSEKCIEDRGKEYKQIENIWELIHRGGYLALIDVKLF